MHKRFERVVSEKNARMRLDQYLVISGIGLTRSQVDQLIKSGKVWVNGQPAPKPGYRVKAGDHIVAEFEVRDKLEIRPQEIPVPIVYEDEDVVVINKPAGMVVHPAKGNLEGTLINALLARYPALPTTSDKTRPGVVHRLDKETSGVMVVAKTDRAVRSLARQMAEKVARRVYLAVVWGNLERTEGVIEAPIGRHPIDRKRMAVTPFASKPAITEYRVLRRFGLLATSVEVSLKTGRTHQIRVHFEYLGHPVVGDPTYGGRDPRKIFHQVPSRYREQVREILQIMPRQALHAWRLRFRHPRDGSWVEVEAPLPEDLQRLLDYLSRVA